MLGLRLTCSRIYRCSTDIDISRSDLKILGKVKRIGTLAHILNGVAIGDRRAILHRHLYVCLLTCGHSLVITTTVLVVVCIGKLRRTAVLDDGIVNGSTQDNLCGAGITAATASTARRYIYGSNLRPALVGNGKAETALVITYLRTHTEHGVGFNLIELGSNSGVLHRVRAVRIKCFVYLGTFNHDIYLAVGIRNNCLTVHAYLLNLTAPIFFPACNIKEVLYRGCTKTIVHPFAG